MPKLHLHLDEDASNKSLHKALLDLLSILEILSF